jgi:hypothetical protein
MSKEKRSPKVLIHDIDLGLASLGSDDTIEEIFGYRPRRYVRGKALLEMFDKLHQLVIEEFEDQLGLVEHEYYYLKEGVELDFEVLDSATAYQAQDKMDIQGEGKMQRDDWGQLGDNMEKMFLKLTRTKTNVIVIAHTKTEEGIKGTVRQSPALSGRMKQEVGRHFDIVAYNRLITNEETGEVQYMWQIVGDESAAAKCRIQPLADIAVKGMIPQDFKLVHDTVTKAGHENWKMLVLGDTGTGKTYSLRTLAEIEI